MAPTGTYSLLCHRSCSATLTVGALGARSFPAGWYVYTGSAFGPGGFSRIDRHREIAAGGRDTRHWHIDYLLGANATSIETAYVTPGEDKECSIAQSLPGEQIAAFGASDCSCASHLTYAVTPKALRARLEALHADTWPPTG